MYRAALIAIACLCVVLALVAAAPAQFQRLAPPPAGGLYHGVYPGGVTGNEDDITPRGVGDYERLVGRGVAWVFFSNNWFSSRAFPVETARWIAASMAVPYIRLMMRSSTEQRKPEETFTLDAILQGRFDADLHRWAAAARDFGGPLLVEWGTEANGEWFPWNGRWNGMTRKDGFGDPNKYDGPERFVAVFRRLVEISRQEGARNISWVFHVDAHDAPAQPWNRFEDYYPGDAYVDWVAVSAYGPQYPTDDSAQSLRESLDEALPRLSAMAASKPVILAEFGCMKGSAAASQTLWARAALADILSRRWPTLAGFSWWNERWENDSYPAHDTDMRVQGSPALAAVFRRAFARAGRSVLDRPILMARSARWRRPRSRHTWGRPSMSRSFP